MTGRIAVGVAGLGVVAQTVHLPLLTRRWDLFDVRALCDLSPALLARMGVRYGIPAEHQHETLARMLKAEALDAVLLLTSGSHGGAVLECLGSGVPVLCEKPLAWSLAEADAVIAASGDRPRVQVAYMKQYDPAVTRMRELLAEVRDVRSVDVEVLHPADAAQVAFANLYPRTGDVDETVLQRLVAVDAEALTAAVGAADRSVRALYSDVVLGSMCHDLSLVRLFFGDPTTIDLVRRWPTGAPPGSVEVSGTLANGAALAMRWHYLAGYPAYRETVTVHHDRGTLRLAFPAPYLLNAPSELLVVESAGGAERRSVFRSVSEEFEQELVGLHAMVTAGARPLSGPGEGRQDIVTAQRITRALCDREHLPLGGEAASA